ncbi:zinc-dependent alcohol dehydrogenase family protein [Flavobacterium sp. ANB]|uniref:zinc-dependent alcohol dehydrogenase family protein n=1 Tax=unclassified Flavobacterium TaxID=196869 RepID=UPI0012B7699B|nr:MULTISPECIES: zinc-dependent alcohol dehydrogenase family protein [unclassified Flavobacterium]MBF4518323.1 zinc-dependent alcohol dehydrogenase family protein [Flavobacterium sp. ANB]MTD70980.1 zinc-binding dehydrogenase [Flavobacterium sp. LC2016-13]
MKALFTNTYESEFVNTEIEKPAPKKGEVLIKIHASGVNPIDNKIRLGLSPYASPVLPAILGTDLAGVIEEIGEGVTDFKVGDEVYGLAGGVLGVQGTLAEYTAVDADLLAIKPKNLTMKEAAGIPLVLLTAWEGLIDRAKVQKGDKVLVHAGAGGVGHMVVQLAKIFGADVYATVSPQKAEIVKSYGATAIDKNTLVEDYVNQYTDGKGFDIIYDTLGGQSLDDSFKAIRHYGQISSCYAFGTHTLATSSLRSASIHGVFVLHPMIGNEGRKHHGDILKETTKLIEEGKLKPLIDPRKFTLDNAMEAHKAVSDGSAIGKIVVDII